MVYPPLVFRNLGNFAPQGRKIWGFLKDFKGNHGPLMVYPPYISESGNMRGGVKSDFMNLVSLYTILVHFFLEKKDF